MNYIEKFVLAVSCNMSLHRKNGKPGRSWQMSSWEGRSSDHIENGKKG